MNTTTARGLPRKTSRTADLAGARGFHPEVFAQANQQAQPTSTARGFHPHAMAQAQALNQQPDSIPAMMKPGEYVLPPDTVQALGGPQALDATVAQTHTPANAGAIVPKGFEPRLFFNNGGLAQDEEQKPKPISPTNTYPQGSPSAGANVYGGAIDATKSAVSAAANPQGGQPLVKGAAQMFGQRQELQQQGRERWDASVAARQPAPAQPVGLPGAASASPSAAPAVTSGFASSQDGMANDFGRQPSSPTPMASAAPSLAPKTPASDPQSRINEQMANAQRQRAEGIAAVQRGQAYDSITQQQRQQAYDTWQSTRQPGILPQPRSDMRQQEAEKAYSDTLAGRIGVATPSSPPEQLAKQLGGLDRQHAQNVQLQAAARTPEQARAEVQQTEGLAQVRGLPGVYQHGRGQYSDNPEGMGFATGFTGQPSAQNMQAANALASQQQTQSMARLQAAERQAAPQARGLQGFEMPRQENAYERENRMRERNRIMGLLQTPMTGDPRRDLTSSQRQQLVAQLGQESQERQATERNMFGLAGQQLNAESQRYSTDANTAVGADRNTIDQQRVGLDGQRLGLAVQQQQEQSTARGFEIRGAQRREGILQQFDAAKNDQERAQLQQRYPDVFGNGGSPWKVSVTPATKNIDGSTSMGSVIRYNDQTGQVEEVKLNGAAPPPPAPKEASKRVVGQSYTAPNGQVAVWNGKDWDAPK